MKLDVPETVRLLLEKADDAESRWRREEQAAADAENVRLRAIAELRIARNAELQQAAAEVFAWRWAFVATDDADRIWHHVGDKTRLTLYVDHFWRGEPVLLTDRACSAALTLGPWDSGILGMPPFWYEERHKGRKAVEREIASPPDLVDGVHPDFLMKLAAHLAGPDAWTWIQRDLERVIKR